jgi:hypothetical protein
MSVRDPEYTIRSAPVYDNLSSDLSSVASAKEEALTITRSE